MLCTLHLAKRFFALDLLAIMAPSLVFAGIQKVARTMAVTKDNCATATNLNTCTAAASFTTTGATQSLAASTCLGDINDDVWFALTAPTTLAQVQVVGTSGIGFSPVI